MDGLFSLTLLTDVFYLTCAHYGCSSRNSYTRAQVQKFWQSTRIKTFLQIFSMTALSLLRVILLSLHESEMDDTIAVYLAYVQLLIAFTDNISLCCELEECQLRERRDFGQNARPQAAAAA
ncbi:hypothetical protein KIN20_015916 [Parelaphostrongylus tenuis]|uniref:Uncharacterized protein n=1 Tax=Parelaphostrongylus tenuis TaxID=148309 RepID=A0AAD5N4Q3_PARTN|nr:hypothetical protein KIN20_015916 [Parelaphostrongylus tenuis]